MPVSLSFPPPQHTCVCLRDALIISDGNAVVTIPVVAHVPCADVRVSGNFNFGTVPDGQRADARLTLTNVGSRCDRSQQMHSCAAAGAVALSL